MRRCNIALVMISVGMFVTMLQGCVTSMTPGEAPDITTRKISASYNTVYQCAILAVQRLGWQITFNSQQVGQITTYAPPNWTDPDLITDIRIKTAQTTEQSIAITCSSTGGMSKKKFATKMAIFYNELENLVSSYRGDTTPNNVRTEPDTSPKSTAPPAEPSHSPGSLTGSGTGFFVTTDGWLVTNAHVVAAGSKAMVKLGDTLYPAVVKQVDAANDIALVKVDGQFNSLPIEKARKVALGTSVFTVGFPNPGLQGFSPKMTKGEISSLAGIKDDPRYFQISAPIQPGNSGGALTDVSGNVVGVVTAKLSDVAGYATTGSIPQNVNYAIKSTYLLALVESIPDAVKGLKGPVNTQDFAAAVQAVEKSSAMVLMFE